MPATMLSLLAALPSLAAAQTQIDPSPRGLLSSVEIVAAIDLNGDGTTELIGAESDRVLRSYGTNAAGQLIRAKDLAPATPPSTIEAIPQVTADLDGDGLLDLVGTRFSSSPSDFEVAVWFDRGGDLFEAPVAVATFDSPFVPYAVLPNDFDGDGDLDLVLHPEGLWLPGLMLGSEIQVRVVFNLGPAGYTAPTPVQTSNEAFIATCPVDLDQDGDIDFVALEGATGAVAILRNSGGSLQAEAVPTSRPATRYLSMGDVNLDGWQDVVAFHTDALSPTVTVGDVEVYLGHAAGALQAPTIALSVIDANPVLALGDVNDDGSLDLLLSERRPNDEGPTAMRVYAGSGAAQFAAPVRSSESAGTVDFRPLFVGDFNGDGRDDVAANQRQASGRRRTVIRNARDDASGASIGFQDPVFTSGEDFVGPALFADFDADGVQDLVAAIEYDDSTQFFPYIVWAQGTVGRSPAFESGRLIGIRGVPVLAADFDGAGPAQLSVVVTESNLGPGLYSVEIKPNGDLEKPVPIAPNAFTRNSIQALDWDQDGDLDLVGEEPGRQSLGWIEQTGPGTFASVPTDLVTLAASSDFVDFLVGDFNGDSTLDVATSSMQLFSNSYVLSWRPGQGGGALAGELPLLTLTSTSAPQVGDFNQDGFSDLAWIEVGSNDLRWIPGGPMGLVASAAQDLVNGIQQGGFISQVDFDGDQDFDILILEETSQSTRTIRGYANLGSGSYSSTPITIGETTPLFNSASPTALTVTDLGGDGDLDLVTERGFWYRNEQTGIRGESYCGPAALSSTGFPARILAQGSTVPAANTLRLLASDLPALSFGYFITSQTPRAATTVPGSSGLICLGGAIGRYSSPSQIQFSGTAGEFSLDLDLNQMPTPNGLIPALAGSVWNFQAWFRDSSPTGATSNFTDAVGVVFQ